MKLLLRGKQSKTKHVVHVKVINLRWISSFLFFPPSPKSCFLLCLPREEDKVWVQSALGDKMMVFPHREGKSFVVGWGSQGRGCRVRGKEKDWLGFWFGREKMTPDHAGWLHCFLLGFCLIPGVIPSGICLQMKCRRRKSPGLSFPPATLIPLYLQSILPAPSPGWYLGCAPHAWLTGRMLMVLFSSRKQPWSLEDSNISFLTKAQLLYSDLCLLSPPVPLTKGFCSCTWNTHRVPAWAWWRYFPFCRPKYKKINKIGWESSIMNVVCLPWGAT